MAKKAKIPDPLSEIAANLVAALESHGAAQQSTPETPCLTWSQLVASQSGVSMEWALAALKKAPAKGNVIIAIPEDPKSPVALLTSVERLVSDSAVLLRLVQHPSTGCSEAIPVRPLAELCRGLDKTLRKSVEAFWGERQSSLPAGLHAILRKVGKKSIISIHDGRFARPEVTLCQRLVKSLESLRDDGDAKYPAEFEGLLAKADVAGNDPLLQVAMAQPGFAEAVTVVAGKLPKAWVAFQNDAERAVNSEGFLKRLLALHCSETTPEVKLSTVAKTLVKDRQVQFMEVWRTHADLQRRFSFVELSQAGSKSRPDLLLRDTRFPRAEKLLSEQLLKVLDGQKVLGGAAYPALWSRLVELTKTNADKSVLQRASNSEPFSSRVVVAFPGAPNSPVAFVDDVADLAASPQLLDLVVSQVVTDDNQAVLVDKLSAVKGMHPLIRPHFASAIERFAAEKRLPSGFGGLRIARKWYIFRMKDVTCSSSGAAAADETKVRSKKAVSGSAAPKADPAQMPVDGFAQDFEAAFERLSEMSRLPGCVSLADLRPALAKYPSDVFDSELIRLRRAGQYSLSVVEGRYPLTDAEREACLVIDNTAHLLVRRRAS